MDLIWDYMQERQIADNRTAAELAAAKADGVRGQSQQLERDIQSLSLACQAMWELLRDHSDLTENDLKAKILEIDARDGVIDGRMGAKVVDCPHCGQKTSTKRGSCVFCGGFIDSDHAFQI